MYYKVLIVVMGESQWKDWKPFIYGGLASIVAELGILYYITKISL